MSLNADSEPTEFKGSQSRVRTTKGQSPTRRRRPRTRLGIDYRRAMKVLRPELVATYDRTPQQLELFDQDETGTGGSAGQIAPAPEIKAVVEPHAKNGGSRSIRNMGLPRPRKRALRRGVEPDVPVAVGMDRHTTLMIQTFGQ